MNAQMLRENRDEFEKFMHTRENGEWELHRVEEWFGRKYAITGRIKLTDGLQRLEVVDITTIETYSCDGKCPFVVALFPQWWGDAKLDHVMIHHSEEGHDTILCENGSDMWVHYADLPIRILPGSPADYKTVVEQQMDELEQSVDA